VFFLALVFTSFIAVATESPVPESPTSAPPACEHPNVPATTLHAVSPIVPPQVVQRGIEGTVQIVVSLDADSHMTGARIYRSPNAILNDVSMEAARHSTFRTAIRNCVPVAAEYIFSVEFARVRS
jgi:hypothetical protein